LVSLFGGAGCAVGSGMPWLWHAMVMLLSVWLPHAFLRVELPSKRQVPPLLPGVEVLWHLLPGMVLSVPLMLMRASVTEFLSSPATLVCCLTSSLWVPAFFARGLW